MSRQFMIHRVQKSGQKGKNTSFTKFEGETFSGSGPAAAASKAFGKLCKSKKIYGQCTLNVSLQEVHATPSGSPATKQGQFIAKSNTIHKYKLKKVKYPNGGMKISRDGTPVTYKYYTKVKAL